MLQHLNFFGIHIPMYSLMIVCGAIAFVLFYLHFVEKGSSLDKVTSNRLLFTSLLGFLVLGGSAFIFNSLFHSIEEGRIVFGGITWLGGVIGVIPAMYFFINKIVPKEKGNEIVRFSTMLPGLVIAHALGRLGCFFGGCCYGKPTDSWLGVVFPAGSLAGKEYPNLSADISECIPFFEEVNGKMQAVTEIINGVEVPKIQYYPSLPVLPTQLIEALFEVILFAVMIIFYKKLKNYNVEIYCFAYGAFRFSLEFLRGDDRGATGLALSPSQIMSIILFIFATLLILYRNGIIFKKLAAKQAEWREEALTVPPEGEKPIIIPFLSNPAKKNSDTLRELHKLHEDGIITDEEYEKKREEILSRM